MEFALTPEQEMMRDSLQRALEARAGLQAARQAAVLGAESVDQAWATLVDLGAAGVLVPEALGGMGLSSVEAMLIAQACGRHVACTPFVASSVMGVMALRRGGSAAQQSAWLPALASGQAHLGVAVAEAAEGARDGAGLTCQSGRLHGTALFVLGGSRAAGYVVADRDGGLYLVRQGAPGLRYTALQAIDRTVALGKLECQSVDCEPLQAEPTSATLSATLAAGRVMVAAEVLGAADHMLAAAVAHAKQRHQFGRPIGSFQAVKHLLADLVVELEPARALVWYAAYVQDQDPARASEVAALAKSHVCEVGTRVARTATEVHGAIGVTDLLGLHYWYKRIGLACQLLGGPVGLRREVGALRMRASPPAGHAAPPGGPGAQGGAPT